MLRKKRIGSVYIGLLGEKGKKWEAGDSCKNEKLQFRERNAISRKLREKKGEKAEK